MTDGPATMRKLARILAGVLVGVVVATLGWQVSQVLIGSASSIDTWQLTGATAEP